MDSSEYSDSNDSSILAGYLFVCVLCMLFGSPLYRFIQEERYTIMQAPCLFVVLGMLCQSLIPTTTVRCIHSVIDYLQVVLYGGLTVVMVILLGHFDLPFYVEGLLLPPLLMLIAATYFLTAVALFRTYTCYW